MAFIRLLVIDVYPILMLLVASILNLFMIHLFPAAIISRLILFDFLLGVIIVVLGLDLLYVDIRANSLVQD